MTCGIIYGMPRARVSTTVDAQTLERCRQLLATSDSRLFDRALAALLEQLEGERERHVLEQLPYHDDPDLAWEAPMPPSLPYDGEVPEDVLRLAESRKRP